MYIVYSQDWYDTVMLLIDFVAETTFRKPRNLRLVTQKHIDQRSSQPPIWLALCLLWGDQNFHSS